MTEAVQHDPRAKARAEAAEALLETAAPDAGVNGLSALRADATQRFRRIGPALPRDEYWRYMGPAPFNKPTPTARPASSVPAAAAGPFSQLDPLPIVFVNGRFNRDLSGDLSAAGVEIAALSDPAAPDWAKAALGRLEAEGQQPVARPYAALNGALATDGAAIRAVGRATRPIELRYLGDSDEANYLRHVIDVQDGGAVTLLETGASAARFSTVIEANLAANAEFHHVRLQTEDRLERVDAHLFARLAEAARLKSFTLSAASGARAIRNESVLWLEEDDASAHVAGAVSGRGKAQIDNTVFLTHGGLRGESRQVYKNVLDQQAKGVFQGKILVRDGAQKTDGYQISQSILLSETASFNAKPELEIYADDVACSHGSTTGALDETALFYLRSRGVEPAVARRLLIEAFYTEAIEEIADPTLREAVETHMRELTSAALA